MIQVVLPSVGTNFQNLDLIFWEAHIKPEYKVITSDGHDIILVQ